MMDGNMTIKRPEVELDPGIVNKSFEFDSRRSPSIDFDIPERDYEVTGNGWSMIRSVIRKLLMIYIPTLVFLI